MYVLDTNAFYYASGISMCTYDIKKLQDLIENNEVFISSTSLFEFLVKYRNDLHTIHKGGKYLWEKKIKVAGNRINPIPNSFSGDIMNITQDELNRLCNDVIDNKIEKESMFVEALFDICVICGFYFSALSEGTEPSDFCFDVLIKTCNLFASMNKGIFKNVFTDGYKSDDCENYVRKSFYNLLAFELQHGIPFIERAKTVGDSVIISDIDKWLPAEDYARGIAKYEKKMVNMGTKKSTAFLHKLAVKYSKSNNDPQLNSLIINIKAIFDKKVRYPAMQDYIYDTLVDIMTKGAALWKNDLLDAIILCNLQDLHILVTYDNGVIKRMEKRKNQYPKYLESLNVIYRLQA